MTTTVQKISACVRCGGVKPRGRGRSLCTACKDASVWDGAVSRSSPSSLCKKCGEPKISGQNLCVECKKSAQKTNRTIKPCESCGGKKDRTGLGVKLCSSCKDSQGVRAMKHIRKYRRSTRWIASANAASETRRQLMMSIGSTLLIERSRNSRLKSDFGISAADYDRMLSEQSGVCAICHQPETKLDRRTSSKAQRLSVDHDHATGAVRGLLCSRCNTGIGLFGDDIDRMLSAIEYLKATGATLS